MESIYTAVFPLEIGDAPLEGTRLSLEPLREEHLREMYSILESSIWQWYTIQIMRPEDLKDFIHSQLKEQSTGKTFAFAIREKSSGKVIGGTRFMNIDRENRRLEIGSTWFHPTWQRTFANTEAKFLMLSHAFEELKCICVQFYTDSLNEKSRRAIERLGARLDGVLRFHRVCHDGRIRHSAVYSICENEWAEIKDRLLGMLGKTGKRPLR